MPAGGGASDPRHHLQEAPAGLSGRGAGGPGPLGWQPYQVTHWRTAKVHQDHHIQCLQALYSVSVSLCPPGQKVEARVDSKLVHIYVGAAWSRPTSASPGPAVPPTPPTTPTNSRSTPAGRPTASRPAPGNWALRSVSSPTACRKVRCPGPSSDRATSSSAWASATRPSGSMPPATGPWRWTSLTSGAWSASCSRPWNRMLSQRHPNRCQPAALPVPAPSLLKPKATHLFQPP